MYATACGAQHTDERVRGCAAARQGKAAAARQLAVTKRLPRCVRLQSDVRKEKDNPMIQRRIEKHDERREENNTGR